MARHYFDGKTVTCADDLNAIKAEQTPGDTVDMTIDRNGKEIKKVTSTDGGNVEDPDNKGDNPGGGNTPSGGDTPSGGNPGGGGDGE